MKNFKVSLFVTCLTDVFSPQVGMATVKVLEHFGCEVDFPEGQTCCGQPAYNNGYPDDARVLAKKMIQVFAESQYIVTPSGSCCAMIREHYLKLLAADPAWEIKAEEFVAKTYEFAEFLTKILKVDLRGYSLPEKLTTTYHFSCHQRGIGATPASATRFLEQLGNVEFLPLEKTEQCCGFGGAFAIKYPDISQAMVKDKVECTRRTGAQVLVVNDGGCTMNIGGACQRHEGGFEVRHLAELIAQALEHSNSLANSSAATSGGKAPAAPMSH